MPAQVVIKLIADPTGLEPGIDSLEKMGQIDKETADQIRNTNKAFQERSKATQGATSSTDKLYKASKKLVESITGGAISDAAKKIEEIGKKSNKASAEAELLAKTIEAAKQKLTQLSKDTPEFDKLSAEIAAAELAIANMGNEASSSRGKLRQYRETLLQLEDAGLDGTQVFEDLAVAAGQLSDQVGDTQNRIKVLASDTFKFDVAIQAAEGVAGAFSVAQGAAALFGSENEDLQKALLKVNAAMAILQGLQSIQNILQRESALNIGATIALQKLSVIQTNLQAAAESRNIVVRYAAIVAQRALNVVMAANPAGAVLFAIAALATGIYALTRNTNEAAEAQKKFNDGLKLSAELADEFTKAIGDAGDVLVAQLEAQGASEAEIRKQRIATLKNQLSEQQRVYQAANANYAKVNQEFIALGNDASKEDIENRQTAYDLANDAAGKYFATQKALDIANLNDVRDRNKERAEEAKKALEDRKKAQEDARKATEAALKESVAAAELQFITAKTVTERLTAQVILANSKLRLALNDPSLGPNARALAEQQTADEIKKFRDDMFKDLEAIDAAGYRASIERQKAFTKERLNEEVLAGAQLAQARLLQQQAEAQRKIEANEKRLAEERDLQNRIREMQLTVASSIAGSLNEIARNQSDKEIAIIQDKENKKLKALQQALDQGAISQVEYNKKAQAIQEEFDRKSRAIKIRAAQQEKQLALFQAGIAQSLAILAILKDQTIPFVSKPIFIGLAVAQALAQLAAIASKPIPAFKDGTKNAPGGLSLIGEAGPELFYTKGNWGYAASATVLDLPKGSKVIPTLETEKIFNKYDIPLPRVPSYVESHQNAIDYRALAKHVGREIGSHLDKLPLSINGYDKDGPWQHITTIQNRHQYLSKRFGRRRRR